MTRSLTPETVWVLVCTYRRPELLAALLESLEAEGVQRLILVDNAPQPEAESLMAEHFSGGLYVHQPEPGLVKARNTSLEAVPSDAEAVVFLDDDEQVLPGWFDALLGCAEESGADAVAGPVLPVFEDGEPAWTASYGYVRRTDRPTGPGPKRLATNNTLVRAEWFAPAASAGRGFRFDETFNLTGGEDSDLFDRLREAGAVFWWCAEAAAAEYVPAGRATQEWLRARALRGGHVRALKQRRRAGSRASAQLVVRVRIGAEGLGRAMYGALRRAEARARRRPISYTDDYYLCEGLGMVASLIGRGRAEYARDEAPPRRRRP
ncbi:glycosyltransferase family 2 protein [Nesterenkonia populi]|uniref:glycosyltransferase family 2 protein n=1 Tax=Nesterenkonia populi TaxID=1591087 RepID=UPI0011BE3E4C|nr:glycosyltransferase [Nesterenkonia populi]